MRLIVATLVLLLTGAFAGEEKTAALEGRIGELKNKLVQAEKAIENADNDEARAKAKGRAQELRAAIERAAQELKAVRAEGRPEKPERKPEAREGGPLEKMVDRIAELRKKALFAKREGRPEQARELWLEAEKLDAVLTREIGEGPAREAGDVPPAEDLERAFGQAKEAIASRRFDAAGEALRRAVDGLRRMVNRDRLGPEDARWCRERIEWLVGSAEALERAGQAGMAQKLRESAQGLFAALDRRGARPEKPDRERPDRPDRPDGAPGAELRQRRAQIGAELEKIGGRLRELEEARAELGKEVERREGAVREAEGEKREVLERELMPLVEKFKAVAAESDELKERASGLERQRARIDNAAREGGGRPRAEAPSPENRELRERLRNIEREMAENAEMSANLRAEIVELEKGMSQVEGERREGMRREVAQLHERLAAREWHLFRLRLARMELEQAAAGGPRREVKVDRPEDPRAEIERLRAEIRDLRRILQEALKKD
ncbi:MAG TPA: hypothetical protein PKJ38_08550 [Planctomycetota bacterium]|nr:hypothetical protein [Planctomycetota bacterium]